MLLREKLVVIGEAIGNLKKAEPTISIKQDKQIISFRNRLVHAYDNIDNAIVWAIIQVHLPRLKEEVTQLY